MAADVASYSFLQSVTLGALLQAVIVRIDGELGPLDFALRTGSVDNPIHTADKVLSAGEFDYYYLGGQANERITIVKRAALTHTRYEGELGERALDQVGERAEEVVDAHVPAPSATIDPPVWGDDASARTFFVTLHDLRPTPALQTVDKIRLFLAGTPAATHDWILLTGPRVIAFPLAAGDLIDNISTNVAPNDPINNSVLGAIHFHATAGGAANAGNEILDARLNFSLDVVAPEDVPTPGGHSTFVEHPRVFHANADATADPDDASLWWVNFSPNEGGLMPVANSLFTFTWNINPGLAINRTTMAARGTAPADATVVLLSNRESGATQIGSTSSLVRGTTYLARYTGASIVILTRLLGHGVLVDNPEHPIAATVDNRDQLLYRAGRLYRGEAVPLRRPRRDVPRFCHVRPPGGLHVGRCCSGQPRRWRSAR